MSYSTDGIRYLHPEAKELMVIGLMDQSAAFNVLQKYFLLGKLEILVFSKSAMDLIGIRQTMYTVNRYTSDTIRLT